RARPGPGRRGDGDARASWQADQFVLDEQLEQAPELRTVDLEQRQARWDLVDDLDFFRGHFRAKLGDDVADEFLNVQLGGELSGRRFGRGPKILQQIVDATELKLDVMVIVLPKLRIAQRIDVEVFLAQLARGQVEKRLHSDQRVADVMAQARGHEAQAYDAV